MKKLLLILALFSLSVSAQQFQGMNMQNEGEMKKMMESMQKLQACMAKINKNELKTIQQKAEKIARDTHALCLKGKRKQAQQKATNAYDEFKNDPFSIKLKNCTDILKNISSENENTEVHICDSPVDDFKDQ